MDDGGQFDEDVVLRLALHGDIELLDPETDALVDAVDDRDLESQSGVSGPQELPESLDDGGGLLLHREERTRQHSDRDDSEGDEGDEGDQRYEG